MGLAFWTVVGACGVLVVLAYAMTYLHVLERKSASGWIAAAALAICVYLSVEVRWWGGVAGLVSFIAACGVLGPIATARAWRSWARLSPSEQLKRAGDASALPPLGPDSEGDDVHRPIPENWRDRVHAYLIRRTLADSKAAIRSEVEAAGSINAWVRLHRGEIDARGGR